jgi:mitochondrial fission protein ELM1
MGIRFAKPGRKPHFRKVLSQPLQILVISDGKPGHENQSLGLAEAMGRRCPVEIRTLRLDSGKGAIGRIRMALSMDARPKPDFVIAAGSATHLPLLLTARKYGAHSIVLMKPGLPKALFGTCIIPEHDFTQAPRAANIILTKGAPNRVTPSDAPRSEKMFLIGGPSKTHGYDEAALVTRIAEIAGDGPWQLADSRRTPPTLLPALKAAVPNLEVFSHGETKPGWLAGKLSLLEEIRVTEDSVSMIYEALSSGARVNVLEMPRIRPGARVLRGLAALEEQGYFGGDAPKTLAEADRCAGIILTRMQGHPQCDA